MGMIICAETGFHAGLPLLPGVATAGEVMAAMEDGLNFLKFLRYLRCRLYQMFLRSVKYHLYLK